MKSLRIAAVVAICAALLAACGPQPAKIDPVASAIGDEVPLYPGLQVTATYPSERGQQVLGQTNDKAEQVAAFYAREMTARHWKRDRSWYTRSDFLVFTKNRRQASITMRSGAPAGVETLVSVNTDILPDRSGTGPAAGN